MSEKVTYFEIDRETWSRGLGHEGSMLRNPEGMRCCLGFYAEACGLSPESILGLGTPSELLRGLPRQMHWLDASSANFVRPEETLVELNDSLTYSDDTREQMIAQVFLRHGVTVRFV